MKDDPHASRVALEHRTAGVIPHPSSFIPLLRLRTEFNRRVNMSITTKWIYWPKEVRPFTRNRHHTLYKVMK
jgi:hypothetical protein